LHFKLFLSIELFQLEITIIVTKSGHDTLEYFDNVCLISYLWPVWAHISGANPNNPGQQRSTKQ